MGKLQFIAVALLLMSIEYRLETIILNRPVGLRKPRDMWSAVLGLTSGVFIILGLAL